jgi:DNA-binding MarR family transcriptional regulator
MERDIIASAEIVSKFCRLHINMKREIPIRPSEMGALIYVQKSEEPVTPVMISNFFGISKPSVTDMVNSLIKKDYLIKTPSDIDKRSYIVTVTEKGHELLEVTFKEYVKTIKLLEEKMGSNEFEMLIQLLEKANGVLGEEMDE